MSEDEIFSSNKPTQKEKARAYDMLRIVLNQKEKFDSAIDLVRLFH